MSGRRAVCRGLAATLAAASLGCRRPASDGRTLRVAMQGEPATLDPHLQDDAITHSVLFNVYEALTVFDADMRLQPALATAWHSRDELTWVFVLRSGARFHDGRVVTPEDVVASLERARHLTDSRTSGYLVGLRQVRMASDSAVEVVTWRPYALLAKKLAFVAILPRDAPQPVVAPIGTGPLRFLRREGPTVLLERHRDYWGPAPAFAQVELSGISDGRERERQLAAGDVDLVLSLDSASVENLGKSAGVTVSTRPSLAISYLGLRCDYGPLADVRVRRAIDLALDRAELVRTMRGGLARPATQVVDRTVFGFDPGLPVPARDIAAARQLLAAAGHGKDLELTLERREGLDSAPVVRQLADAGFRVGDVGRPWADMLARLGSGQVQIYLGGLLCPTGDASDVLDVVLHSRNEATGYGSGNHWGFASADLDVLIEKSDASFDQTGRLILLQQAMRLVASEMPMVPLLVPYNAAGVREGVTWQPRLDGFLRVAEARPS